MTTTEISVIVVGGFVGYWVVANLILGDRPRESTQEPVTASRTNAQQATPPDEEPWHVVLKVHRHASLQEIREAYQSQISQYDPTRVAHLGEEIREVAERRSKQLDAAYQRVLKERGAQ